MENKRAGGFAGGASCTGIATADAKTARRSWDDCAITPPTVAHARPPALSRRPANCTSNCLPEGCIAPSCINIYMGGFPPLIACLRWRDFASESAAAPQPSSGPAPCPLSSSPTAYSQIEHAHALGPSSPPSSSICRACGQGHSTCRPTRRRSTRRRRPTRRRPTCRRTLRGHSPVASRHNTTPPRRRN